MAGPLEGTVILAVFLLLVAVTAWVYSDARRNSPHSPFLWALVALFGGVLGLLLYLLLGRKPGRGRPARTY